MASASALRPARCGREQRPHRNEARDEIRVLLLELDQVISAARIEQPISRILHASRQLADEWIVAESVGLLHFCQQARIRERRVSALLLGPHPREVGVANSGRPREEIRPHSQVRVLEFEVCAPSTGHPAYVEGGAESVASPVSREQPDDMGESFAVFPQDPVAILARDRQTMEDGSLTATDDGTKATSVELAREIQIDRHW
jgi:hypothetical protein